MAALAEDIARARRRAVIVEQTNSAVQARYPRARDMREEPAPGYFDSTVDCAAALVARADLLGTERKRFLVRVGDMLTHDLSAGLPCWRLIAAEQGFDAVCLVGRVEVDLENETTGLELFG